jgi:D-alanyl-D-alanine carboxypeptidase
VILKLEAAGKLSIDDTLGKWLPEYPAWKYVTIRRLLNTTSGIPNYSETEWMSRAWANEPMRAFTLKELADAAYPSATNQLPASKGYHYSNTNYVLSAMIAEKASGKSFTLTSAFYEASTYPEPVIKRLSHGYFENKACTDYQPECKESWKLPVVGRGRARDEHLLDAIGRWRRFQRPRPRSLDARGFRRQGGSTEAAAKTGEPITRVSADDPGLRPRVGSQDSRASPRAMVLRGRKSRLRTIFVWIADQDLMITVQTNTQPPEGTNKLGDAIKALYEIVKKPKADSTVIGITHQCLSTSNGIARRPAANAPSSSGSSSGSTTIRRPWRRSLNGNVSRTKSSRSWG